MVSIDELSQYLHLPEKAVAKELGICLTSLKKLCRQHGITRWPYRKLKSLDKKFAKADGSTGVVEDPETLKARAEELRKEKMALAFSYGIKVGKEGGAGGADSLEKGAETCGAGDESPESSSGRETPPTDVSDMLSVEDMLSSEIAKAVSNPRKDPEADGTSELSSGSTPSSVMAKSAPHVWPAHGSRDSPSSIPTPPGDEPFHTVGDTVGEGVDADMLNEAACHVMASTALMEDSRMSACISWEAPSLDDSVVEPSGDCDGETQTKSTAPMSMSCTGMACSPDFPVCASSSKKKAGDKKALAGKGGAPAISKAQHSARRGAVDKKGASERAQDVSTRGGKVEEKTGRGEREDDEEAEEVGAERSGGRFEIDDDLTVMDHDLKDHDFFGGMSVMSTMSTVDGDDAGYHVHASSYHARQPGPVPHAARSKTSGGRAHGHALQSALVSSEALQPLQSSKDDSTLFGNPLENALELELPHDDSLTTVSKDSILGESWETHNWPGGIKEECGGRGGTSTGRSGQANRKVSTKCFLKCMYVSADFSDFFKFFFNQRLRDSLPDTPEAITPGTREIKSWFPAASPAASPGEGEREINSVKRREGERTKGGKGEKSHVWYVCGHPPSMPAPALPPNRPSTPPERLS